MHRLVTSQEDERRRISRELHDQMGQNLAALMMGLKALPEMCAPAGKEPLTAGAAELFRKLQDLTTQLSNQVHYLAWELRPAALDNLGLEAALKHYIAQWRDNNGVEAEFLSNGLKRGVRLPWHVETTLYRAVQEALLNVAKHARAGHVAVLLEKRGAEVVAVIEDNGVGFDVAAPGEQVNEIALKDNRRPATQHLGLIGMRERMSLIGGSLEIESARGRGTTIYLRAPLERRSQRRAE
jgi:signal transduction histidine kinase